MIGLITPERAEYHRAMLMVGMAEQFYRDFDEALETEDPLSDLVLSLCSCVSDIEQVKVVLREYTLDYTLDERMVFDFVLEDIRSRFLNGMLSRSQVVYTLYEMVKVLDKLWEDPWSEVMIPFYDLEMWEDGLISEKVFHMSFDAWLFRGEDLDCWELQGERILHQSK